jgi:hypothetical protein
MLPNAFIGRLKQPTVKELAAALGPTMPLWDQLLTHLSDDLDADIHEWNSYSPKAGWSLKVRRGKRTIVYLAPCPNAFRVAFVLGDKAVNTALQSRLPQRLLKMIKEAKRYPEGTALRMEVKKASDLPAIHALAAIKLKN